MGGGRGAGEGRDPLLLGYTPLKLNPR